MSLPAASAQRRVKHSIKVYMLSSLHALRRRVLDVEARRRATAMPKSKMDKVSVDDRDDKPALIAPIFVFVAITVATVLAAVLIGHAVRILFNWIAG